jgi:hypothetical protein
MFRASQVNVRDREAAADNPVSIGETLRLRLGRICRRLKSKTMALVSTAI